MPNLLARRRFHAAFSCRRRRLLPAADRRIPDLAVACRADARPARQPRRRGPRRPSLLASQPLEAPEASAKSREEKRFSRADKNKDGKIEAEELLEPRRKAFAKLDINGNGTLSFEEWAVTTIDKFKGADKDRNGWLTAGRIRDHRAAAAEAQVRLQLSGRTRWHADAASTTTTRPARRPSAVEPIGERGPRAVGVGLLAVGLAERAREAAASGRN